MVFGLCRDKGRENGKYYSIKGHILGYIGVVI